MLLLMTRSKFMKRMWYTFSNAAFGHTSPLDKLTDDILHISENKFTVLKC